VAKLPAVSAESPHRQTLQYGAEQFTYQLFFVPTEGNRIVIDVLPSGVINVQAPEHTAPEAIKRAMLKRARWLYHQIGKIHRQHAYVLPREYVSGESHYYLGRRHLLKVMLSKEDPPQVKMLRGQLQVITPSRDPELVKSLLHDWYCQRANEQFARRLQVLSSQTPWIKQTPRWQLRPMKKQWGSCSPKGALSLNPFLVKAPRECIDYVIVHELCHLKEHNHSKNFYLQLSKTMPDWQSAKARLDSLSELLLAD
jgi:predicted metal-dependent hydrolase